MALRVLLAAVDCRSTESAVKADPKSRFSLMLLATVGVFLLLGLVPRFATWIGLSATAALRSAHSPASPPLPASCSKEHPTGQIFPLVRFGPAPPVTALV
jgi:hypothetical protein